MFFDDWKEKSEGCEISKSLLWEYNMDEFDWDYMRRTVVQRVIERGWPKDYYAAIKMYGGLDNFREIIKNEVPYLSERDMNFVCVMFNLKKEELKCYTRKQLREKLLSY